MNTFSEEYLISLLERLKSTPRRDEKLEELLKSEKVSPSAYEEIEKRIRDNTHTMKKAWNGMTGKLRAELEDMEKTIKVLEIQQAKIEVSYAVGELTEEAYRSKSEALELGLSLLRDEAEKIKELLEGVIPSEPAPTKAIAETVTEILPMERAFHFYTDYGQRTGRHARSLSEFAETVRDIEARSLRFHLMRGDFQRWVRDLGDPELALALDGIRGLELDDNELRDRICDSVRRRIGH